MLLSWLDEMILRSRFCFQEFALQLELVQVCFLNGELDGSVRLG